MRRHPLRHARRAYLLPALLLASLAAALLTGSARPPAADAAVTGLVGAYSFNAGSGAALADSSGSANNGTISGPTWTTAGKNGNALSFDGVNDWVTIADSSSLDLSSGMTLEAWVRPQGSNWRTVAFKERTGGLAYALYSNTDTGRPSAEVRTSAGHETRGPAALPSATWSHLAATYNGSTLRLYVNGAQVSSKQVNGALANGSGPLHIGGNSVWAEWFSGQIDDLRVYNRALTVAEVQSDMNTPVGGTPPPPPPPADTQAPTAPSGLTASGQTQTQITLNWTASSDNVAVTGYSRYSNGTLSSSGTGNSFSFTGLTCGTSYTLAVDAYDAAGNRSTRPSISAATLACSTGTGPIAAYSFDATSGTSLTDNSGSGNTGSISGATWTSAGKSGGALNFDGVNDLVTVADKASLDLTTGMTLEAWVRPTANSTWRTVVTKEMSGNLTYGLFSNSDVAQPSSIVTIGANPVQDITRGTAEVPMSAWAHLASTYDGAVLRLYFNGTQVSSKNVTGAMANSAGPLQIGGNNVWAEWFQGQMDDLRVYNRALTPSQLQTDMNTPVAPPPAGDSQAPSAPAGLVVSGQTQTALTLSWNASTDNVGVTGYSTYRNSAAAGTTTPATRTYTYTGLACGTAYSLGVDAVDAAGNRSAQATASGSTSACTPGDTQAPSTPAGLVVSGQTQTALTLSWNASTDNVGVTGYSTYRNSAAAGTTTAATRTYTYTGLACGTAYSLGVDAVDAAGNRSSQATASGSTSACSPPPPGGNVANLWVDPNGGSCARNASAVAYADATACGSLNAAYQAAANGDTVRVRGGSYSGQNIGQKDAAAAPGITITNATGETVEYASLTVKGSFVRVGGFLAHDLSVDGAGNNATNRPVEEVVVENFEIDGRDRNGSPIGYLRGVRAVTWRNGEIHSNKNMSLVLADQDASAGALNQVTFDKMVFHDALLDSGSGAHTECLYAQGINNLRITNSHFYRCAVMDVFITRWTGTNVDPIGGYIENNIFETPLSEGNVCCAANAFHFRNGGEPAPNINNWDFRYNLFVGALSLGGTENAIEGGGLRVIGNTFLGSSTCKAGGTWTANVHGDGSSCGGSAETTANSTTIRAGYAGYVGSIAGNNNWRLTPTSILIDKGTTTSYPTLDTSGTTRYGGAAPDSGPYEYRP